MLENITFEELGNLLCAELKRTLTQKDIELFAAVSGDANPRIWMSIMRKNSLFHGDAITACGRAG